MKELTDEEKVGVFLLAHPEIIETFISILEPIYNVAKTILNTIYEMILKIIEETAEDHEPREDENGKN